MIIIKLFLCGGGSNKQIMFALKKFKSVIANKNKPILYIPLAMNETKYTSCKKWFSQEIKYIGINSFEMISSSKELSEKNFNDYSALFIGGGNTFKLLNELRQNENLKKIKDYLKKDGIIFGSSAGAIIFGKNINSCLLSDKNIVKIKNCDGLNFLKNYSILCHFKKSNFKNNVDYLKQFSKNNKLLYLPEENVIFINDNRIKMIGTNKYVKFVNGKFFIHNFANFKKDINETN